MAGSQGNKWIWRILLIVCVIAFTVSAAMVAVRLLPPLDQPSAVTSTPSASTPPEVLVDNPINFKSLQKKNSDIIGWIRVDGTRIDYPILQSGDGTVESFYLDHNPDRERHRAGSIYIQKMNAPSFLDPNTVVYGHYMANGSMFADLHQFRKEAFFAENDTITVYTPDHIYTYRIYAAFVFDDRHILNSYDFHIDEGYEQFLAVTRDPPTMRRQMREGVEVTTDDRIITLSTCTGVDTERYLVVGVLIDEARTK